MSPKALILPMHETISQVHEDFPLRKPSHCLIVCRSYYPSWSREHMWHVSCMVRMVNSSSEIVLPSTRRRPPPARIQRHIASGNLILTDQQLFEKMIDERDGQGTNRAHLILPSAPTTARHAATRSVNMTNSIPLPPHNFLMPITQCSQNPNHLHIPKF